MKHRMCFKENKQTQEKKRYIKRTFKQQNDKHNFYIEIANKESNNIKPKKQTNIKHEKHNTNKQTTTAELRKHNIQTDKNNIYLQKKQTDNNNITPFTNNREIKTNN